MSIFAAVMTGTGTGALSTIQVFGDDAEGLIKQLFTPTAAGSASFEMGKILLGTIRDGDEIIDQVTIGCEGPETFAIHCHGNPLIVERIMQRLECHGAALLTSEQLLKRILTTQKTADTIVVEAKLAQAKARTLQGTRILTNQIGAGLSKKARCWLEHIDEIPLDTIKAEANRILQKSQTAKLIIYGCTAVLAGPPNSGKSTLLNYLAGRRKSIVTDIEGTTRDWVEATCPVGPLSVTLIDTAGLVRELPGAEQTVKQAAREKTVEILNQADLVLLVLDNSRPMEKLDDYIIETITGRKVVTALNKSDLPARFDAGRLPKNLSNTVQISAKSGAGIEELKERIQQTCGVAHFEPQQPVCFTTRQENLLRQLIQAESKQQAASNITELLNGQDVLTT
jgi:tRNA modification GTPase